MFVGNGKGWKSYIKDRTKYGFLWSEIEQQQQLKQLKQQQQHPLIARGRKRMGLIDGMSELVRNLCDYDPNERVDMHEAIRSEVFETLRT